MTFCLFSFIHFQLYFQQCISDHISKNRMENVCCLLSNSEGGKCCVMKTTFCKCEDWLMCHSLQIQSTQIQTDMISAFRENVITFNNIYLE